MGHEWVASAHDEDDVDNAAAVLLHVRVVHLLGHDERARPATKPVNLPLIGSQKASNATYKLVRMTASQPLRLMLSTKARNWPPADDKGERNNSILSERCDNAEQTDAFSYRC